MLQHYLISLRPLLMQSLEGAQNQPLGSHALPWPRNIHCEYAILASSISPIFSRDRALAHKATETSLTAQLSWIFFFADALTRPDGGNSVFLALKFFCITTASTENISKQASTVLTACSYLFLANKSMDVAAQFAEPLSSELVE